MENKGKTVTDKSKLANLFNSHYINTEEKMSGCPPEIEGSPENKTNGNCTNYYSGIPDTPQHFKY